MIPILVAGAAHADEKNDLITTVIRFEISVVDFQGQGINGEALFAAEPAQCTDAVAKLEALGVPPGEMINGYQGQKWPFKRARDKCRRYAEVRQLAPTFAKIREAEVQAGVLASFEPGDSGATLFAGKAADAAKACLAALDAAAAKGAPMDVAIQLNSGGSKTGTEVHGWCDELARRAGKFQGASAGADADKKKKAHDRYAKHGAAADKLEWLIYYDADGSGHSWRLSPDCRATDDPKTLAKAKVLINWTVGDDGTQHVQKLTFKGNKLVKTQNKSFSKPEKAHAFCK
jgi:hypothetical protein